jgi:HAMP domain-containing protein
MLSNRSIATQFAVTFIVSLLVLGGAFYFILDRVYYNQLKSQAETVADNVDAFGNWVAQYGRVWVKDNDQSYLGHMPVFQPPAGITPAALTVPQTVGAPDLTLVNFYSKNPALAQREFSEAVEKSASPAKFRMTSHNFMNPVNRPDEFEERALQRVRDDKLKEYYEVLPGSFRYARTLYHKATCIGCHGDPKKAPTDVKVRYGLEHGFNFKEGDVAGVISVRLPTRPFLDVALSVIAPWQIALILASFAISSLFIQFGIVRPIERLTKVAAQVSIGEKADLDVSGMNPKSRNELHQLALATDRLRTSLEMVAARLRAQRKKSMGSDSIDPAGINRV